MWRSIDLRCKILPHTSYIIDVGEHSYDHKIRFVDLSIGPRPTSNKAGMLKSSVDERRLTTRRSTVYLNRNERDFWKIVKKSGMDVRSWNFFTSRYNPRLNVKKISASYVHFWFFYNSDRKCSQIGFCEKYSVLPAFS